MSKKSLLVITLVVFALLAVILFEFAVYMHYEPVSNIIGKKTKEPAKVTLEFWGVWDNSDSLQPIIDKYQAEKHIWGGREVQVKINYTKKDIASYEKDIEKSYSEQNSPSIYLVNNYWLGRYAGAQKLQPLSNSLATIDEYGLLSYDKLSEIYPPYVLQEAFYTDNQLYAAPIYSDSLALYYNKEIFQKAGITAPPATWEELKADVKKLTLLDKKNQIVQSGIAMGTGKNTNRACDIFTLLTLQGGGKVIDQQGNIDFTKKIGIQTSDGVKDREPGLTALQFYMDFSDTNKETYSWNDTFANSIQDFADGKVAMMINYNYQRPNLLALKPELSYGIAPIPQLGNSTPISLSNSWMPVVSNQASCRIEGDADDIDCSKVAWSFLSFLSQKENVSSYLEATGKASARLDLSAEQAAKEDNLAAFAKQASIARSYNKFDDRIDSILTEMLDKAYANRSSWKTQADAAATEIEGLKINNISKE